MNCNKLKAAMVEAEYNQRSLAKIMNMSVNTLNAKLNGKSKITVEEAVNFAQALNLERNRFCEIFLPSLSQNGTIT